MRLVQRISPQITIDGWNKPFLNGWFIMAMRLYPHHPGSIFHFFGGLPYLEDHPTKVFHNPIEVPDLFGCPIQTSWVITPVRLGTEIRGLNTTHFMLLKFHDS